MKILLLEDDVKIAKNVQYYLSQFKYSVDIAKSISQGLELNSANEYDLYIVDRMLPDGIGDDFLVKIRNDGTKSPIILLTAMSQLEDKVAGLNLGADDYITKPFHLPELHARIKALLRRPSDVVISPIISIDDLTVDTNNQKVRRGKDEITLSPKLYSLLEYLAVNENVIVSREDILEKVWDKPDNIDTNTVDVHISYLRKLIDDKYEKKLIKTAKGKGYYICGE